MKTYSQTIIRSFFSHLICYSVILAHPKETMIAYKESDIIEPSENQDNFMPQFPKTCGYVKEDHPDESDNDFVDDEAELVKAQCPILKTNEQNLYESQ